MFIKVFARLNDEYDEQKLFIFEGLTVEGKIVKISIEEYQKYNTNWNKKER